MTILNKNQIRELLPHREPMLLIDELHDIKKLTSATAVVNVRKDSFFVQGHFPGQPVMPGVLIVESFGQAAAALTAHGLDKSTYENSKILCNMSEKGIYFKNLKLAAESLCLQFDNPKIRVIRLSNLYGEHFDKQIYLMPSIIRNIKNNKKIILSISPSSKKNYLHIEDAIKVSLNISKKGKF